MSLFALKEWDAQVQALVRGDVAVLVRKGGIMETHEGFEVEHRDFLLYPTFLHQNPAELRAPFQPLLRADAQPGQIAFPALAEVVQVWKIEDLEKALRLEPLQALNASAIERRFNYRGRPWVHALLVRVRPLTAPLVLNETPEMLGCVSWVPLPEQTLQLGEPALGEEQLAATRDQLQALLNG